MNDEDLAIATRARANTDGRYVDRGGNFWHEGSIHAFYDDRESARVGDGLGVGEEADLVSGCQATATIASGVDTLGHEPDMAHHWDAGVHEFFDVLGERSTAFNLDALGAPLLQECTASLEEVRETVVG
jgi:hypothetical protein